MNDKEIESLKQHVAGATVQHRSPFDDLQSFKNEIPLTKEFIDSWIIPFYSNLLHTDSKWINQLQAVKKALIPYIIEKSLGDFNWRTRQTGAFFSAITNQTQFIDIIGTHLLKSEVCYAGRVYCQVFASFNLPECVDYLNTYLDYYLKKSDLWFDQREAMEAILYLDKLNSTNHFDRHINNWIEFVKNKHNWSKEIKTENLEKRLNVIQTVRQYAC